MLSRTTRGVHTPAVCVCQCEDVGEARTLGFGGKSRDHCGRRWQRGQCIFPLLKSLCEDLSIQHLLRNPVLVFSFSETSGDKIE